MLKISFVIPTLNFGKFIGETLDSIHREGYQPVEVIVFDGGSTDDTLDVVEEYRLKFNEFRVVQAQQRGNIDIDLNEAVAAARGDYIWTLSADDVLIAGWSRPLLFALTNQEPDLLLVPATHCDLGLKPLRNYPILKRPNEEVLVSYIHDDEDLLKHLARLRTSEGLFSFCSACIVRREKIQRSPLIEEANGTCWRYAVRLVNILLTYPSKVVVLNKSWILKRGDNDSFAKSGVVRRLQIATVNWDQAIKCLSVPLKTSSVLLSLVKSDIRLLTLFYSSQFVRNNEERLIFRACVRSRLGSINRAFEKTMVKVLSNVPSIYLLRKFLIVAKCIFFLIRKRFWEANLYKIKDSDGH